MREIQPPAKLDGKGRCCGRKPLIYRTPYPDVQASPFKYCPRCDRAFNMHGEQIQNSAWVQYEGGFRRHPTEERRMSGPVEIAQRAVMIEAVCGCTLENGERVFCDDARLPDDVKQADCCYCKREGTAVLAALEAEGWRVVAREPTKEMVRAMDLAGFKASVRMVSTDVFKAAVSAAPTWGKK